MTLSTPLCFFTVRTDGMVKRDLTGGAHQEGQVIFLFRVAATVGFVITYASCFA